MGGKSDQECEPDPKYHVTVAFYSGDGEDSRIGRRKTHLYPDSGSLKDLAKALIAQQQQRDRQNAPQTPSRGRRSRRRRRSHQGATAGTSLAN